ncbi:hypothetical protein OG897_08370 [Streptomyces sp. NBC_00237]|uniref:hypothetical protein n=1 Tax=Streptomyces sp. NBC_00237 TaxID=2975687 RepID=UPI00225274A7|nr:hypothetical protein [Streptomyces sp. NBC_00237]MCX5201466.1 hypothetical protein [Streptomyces sp. NBC_00237]
MTYESGNDRPAGAPQARGEDTAAHGTPAPSARGVDAEPDALHDPVRAERQKHSARDFGVTGAGGSPDIGPLHRPPQQEGHRAAQPSEGHLPPRAPDQAPGRTPDQTLGHTPGQAPAHQPGAGAQLLPHGERDKLGLRLQQAVNHFVDEPRRAVEEADHVLEETARHLTETLAEHRRSLRGAWESADHRTETEELRVALRKYREVTERLLQI